MENTKANAEAYLKDNTQFDKNYRNRIATLLIQWGYKIIRAKNKQLNEKSYTITKLEHEIIKLNEQLENKTNQFNYVRNVYLDVFDGTIESQTPQFTEISNMKI